MALQLDIVLAVVDYRLAPETQAPGAAEDGYLALAIFLPGIGSASAVRHSGAPKEFAKYCVSQHHMPVGEFHHAH
jgi:hypothetical protein